MLTIMVAVNTIIKERQCKLKSNQQKAIFTNLFCFQFNLLSFVFTEIDFAFSVKKFDWLFHKEYTLLSTISICYKWLILKYVKVKCFCLIICGSPFIKQQVIGKQSARVCSQILGLRMPCHLQVKNLFYSSALFQLPEI